MRKTKEDYLNNIKKDLDIGNNFVDYFITIGLKEEVIFSDYLYTNDLETLNKSEFVKPDIISKFPPVEKSLVTADENIIRVNNNKFFLLSNEMKIILMIVTEKIIFLIFKNKFFKFLKTMRNFYLFLFTNLT